MDFFRVCIKENRKKGGPPEVYADYTVGRSKDLMVQGGAFYAVWDEEKGLWSRDEYDVQILVDKSIRQEVEKQKAEGVVCDPKYLTSFDNGRWEKFRKFLRSVSDNSHPLDGKLTFKNTEVKKTDYASRRLSYDLAPGDIGAYDELMSLLYSEKERAKIEWAIGAVISGDAKKIQKFMVFYGSGGTGKSTVMDIIGKLLGGKVKDGGYVAFFDAEALTGSNNAFSTEAFKDNPLVAIQHDGDLSKIESNAKLNSVVSHEDMKINEKYKAQYDTKINAFLFMGTNKPVKITDAKSGLIRRLIDVNPTGETHAPDRYHTLISRIDFELGAIAHHCLQVYRSMGKNAYSDYKPTSMLMQTNVFFNFVDEHFDIFKGQDSTTLKQAWELYKAYAEEAELGYKMKQHLFREELKNYFEEFHDRVMIDGVQARSVYRVFKAHPYKAPVTEGSKTVFSLVMEETESLLDEMYAGLPAQYANSKGNPAKYWDGEERIVDGELKKPRADQISRTYLGDLDTSKLHFLQVPPHHIVIDFDLRGEDGEKSLEKNLQAASSWPATYGEFSKSGNGVHLHYIYDGDTSELASEYSEGIEIKVYNGNSALRRKLTKCNNISVTTISSGLPFREKKMLTSGTLKSEKGLRDLIMRNLQKEIHPGTKPSIDFIEKILSDAKKSGMVYDVTDMMPKIMGFAASSRNKSHECLKAVARMKNDLKSDDSPGEAPEEGPVYTADDRIVFFDCEVYPNLFAICWKYEGEGSSVVRMLNPTPQEVEQLFKFKLVGYNNRSYDNHILWARMLGASNQDLYELSQKIIVEKDDKAKFGGAWSASYADVYDFLATKQTLKKWEIQLGIPHVEMDIPWDEPVPDDKIMQVLDYCSNDVLALEAVFNHRKQDFVARQILADLSGLTVNHSTRQHAIRIMFGNEREPQKKFVYTDLSEMFPGYQFNEFAKGDKSTYKGETIGEGGLVRAKPGMYENVAVLDIASMHPTSIIQLNAFGPYTEKFQRLVEARLALKHGDYDRLALLLPGIPIPTTKEEAKALSDALKLVINSIYGYTCAKFENPFRDKRNKDNIVAKRGALSMVDIKNAVEEQGFEVIHIKTDSIKIPNATPEIIAFVQNFGAKYGYTFEHEATYKKMCLVNDAVFIAYVGWNADDKPEHWKAVGAEFQHPYVFKTLFTDEPISFNDLCETKQVKEGAMYLRFNGVEKEIGDKKDDALENDEAVLVNNEDTHVGRSGLFVPINPDQDMFKGGQLLRIKDGKEYAVTGTKGYLWAEAEMIRALQGGAIERMVFEPLRDAVQGTGSIADVIDMSYYNDLAEEAAESIEKFGNFEGFVQ